MPMDQNAGQAAADAARNSWIAVIEKNGGKQNAIARELCAIAFARIDDFVTISEGGEVQAIPLDKIPQKKLAAVKKIKEHTRITESADGEKIWKESHVEYELHDKQAALRHLVELRGDKPADKHEMLVKPLVTFDAPTTKEGDE